VQIALIWSNTTKGIILEQKGVNIL